MFGMVNVYNDKDFNGDFIKIMKAYLEHDCEHDCCRYFLSIDVVIFSNGLLFKYTAKMELPLPLPLSDGKEWSDFVLNCLTVIYENVLYFNFKSIDEDYKKGYALVNWAIENKRKKMIKLECSKLLENASKVAQSFVTCKRVKEFTPLHVINQR